MRSNLQSIIKELPKDKNTIIFNFKLTSSNYKIEIYINKNKQWGFLPLSIKYGSYPMKYQSRKVVLDNIKYNIKRYILSKYNYRYSYIS